MNSMSLEERRPVIRMNVLQRVLVESQRTQRDMQSLAQKYMRIVPTMPTSGEDAGNEIRNAAMDVLPADFLSGAEEQHDAIQNVPFEKRLPVLQWNTFMQVCSAIQYGFVGRAQQAGDDCCKPNGG